MSSYVWRVEITAYPEGAHEPGFEPQAWREAIGLDQSGPLGFDDPPTFSWPMRTRFLSRGGAMAHADRLRSYGATVEVHRSKPIEWAPRDQQKVSQPA